MIGGLRTMLMGSTTSRYEQPTTMVPPGVCSSTEVNYSPMSQPCANDFFKTGLFAHDTTITRMEHLRPGMYSGIKGGYDAYWKVPSYGNP
mmetsp:Transcript_36563/g.93385  ORF Transcript_36563/g.93385 Transcript_36563/m.93385 type:complete len:90 (+) Transcript_36563:35-304(+)